MTEEKSSWVIELPPDRVKKVFVYICEANEMESDTSYQGAEPPLTSWSRIVADPARSGIPVVACFDQDDWAKL